MQLKIENPNLPPGQYLAVFEDVTPTNHDKYGPGLLWSFRVTHGDESGRKAQRTTKPNPTPRNSCGKFLAGLVGGMPQEGQVVDTDACIGRQYRITIADTNTPGITRIEHVQPVHLQGGQHQPAQTGQAAGRPAEQQTMVPAGHASGNGPYDPDARF